MIFPSPKTTFARDLIARLQSLPELSPHVLPAVFSAHDQYQLIKTNAAKFGGVVVVTPQMLSSEGKDVKARDGWLYCDYAVMAIVNSKAWRIKSMIYPESILTASDWVDALLGQCVELIAGWNLYDVMECNPCVLGEQDVVVPDESFRDCIIRALIVRVGLNHPTYK